jgi:bacillithiol biosynthesis cysteine-adding enzyme BshC
MAALTAELGLIFFNPSDPDIKRLAAPLFRQIAERQTALHEALDSRNAAIERDGYHLQVEKSGGAAHLFYTTPARTPIHRDDSGFTIGARRLSQADLLRLMADAPERFSTDVLTRPLLQSFLFPVIQQSGGPAELAYMAQLNPLFDVFEIVRPLHQPRPTATLIEPRHETALSEYGIDFLDLTGDIEQVINRVLARTFPPDLESDLAALRESLADGFARLRDKSLSFDSQLSGVADQTQGKLDFTLKQFEEKVFAAHKRKSRQTRDRLYRLCDALMLNRGLQERSLNITCFVSRYGRDVVRRVYERLDCACTDHQLISPAETTPV